MFQVEDLLIWCCTEDDRIELLSAQGVCLRRCKGNRSQSMSLVALAQICCGLVVFDEDPNRAVGKRDASPTVE
jgi:hypothetical protein